MRVRVLFVVLAAFVGAGFVSTPGAAGVSCAQSSAQADGVSPIGGLRWSTYGPDWPFAMAADGDLIVAVGLAGDVGAHDAATGEVRWVRPLGAPTKSWPEIASHVVLAPAGRTLSALDRNTGDIVWEHRIKPNPILALVRESDRETLYMAESSVQFSAIDVTTGDTSWSVDLDRKGMSQVSIAASTDVVVASLIGRDFGRWYVALDPTTGQERWRAHARLHSQAPVLVDGMVLIPKTGPSSQIVARDAVTGDVRWTRDLGGSLVETHVPAGDTRHSAFLDRCGTMTLLESATGKIVWTAATGDPPPWTFLRLTPTHVALSRGSEVVTVDRVTGEVVRTDGAGMTLRDLAPVGDRLVLLLDVELSGVLAEFDRGAQEAVQLH